MTCRPMISPVAPSWKNRVFISSVCSVKPAIGGLIGVPVSMQRGAVPPPGSQPVTRIEPSQVQAAECQLGMVAAPGPGPAGAVVAYRKTGCSRSEMSKTGTPGLPAQAARFTEPRATPMSWQVLIRRPSGAGIWPSEKEPMTLADAGSASGTSTMSSRLNGEPGHWFPYLPGFDCSPAALTLL